jgi:pimeloyl-ACP methyl ester carboxylesterase
VSPDGPGHFPVVAQRVLSMHQHEPAFTTRDLAAYPHPALVMIGDDDEEIPIEHTLAFRAGLPDAQLCVVPGAGHGSLGDKPALCNHVIVDFLTEERTG